MKAGYTLYILARQAMKQDISVNTLVNKFNKDSFRALYVNFDTGKATIKPDSSKTLDDAAGALKTAPGLKTEVGGHTGNVDTPQSNEPENRISIMGCTGKCTGFQQRGHSPDG